MTRIAIVVAALLAVTVKGGAKLDHDGGGTLDHLAAGRSV